MKQAGVENPVHAAYRLGANSYLVKPVTSDKLSHIAKLINQYWLTLNQPSVQLSEFAAELACAV